MEKVCFVDTETTGLDPERHEIWEVGLITPDGEEHKWVLPMEDLANADPIALNIGRFHQRHPQGNECRWGPGLENEDPVRLTDPENFATQFAGLTHGCHLAGAVVSFDEERLRKLLRYNDVSPSWHYHLIDVENLAVGFLKGLDAAYRDMSGTSGVKTPEFDGALPWDSEVLSRAVGVRPEDFDRHTALGDARWAKAIYESIVSDT